MDVVVFSEVCGHFYVAAGRWAAKRRLAELTVGGAVLTNCISCHNHHHSPVEATTSPDLGSILAVLAENGTLAGMKTLAEGDRWL